MSKTKLYLIFSGIITNFMVTAVAVDSITTTVTTAPEFTPSNFQINAYTNINDFNTKIDNFLKKQEIIDLNYGLHIVNFINDDEENQLQKPEQQFIKDFARMSCYSNYESRLPECNTENNKNSDRTYGFLRPSNIFDLSRENPEEQALAKFAAKTMIEPLPDPKLNELLQGDDINDPTTQKNIANLIAAQAPITLAKNSLNHIIAKRTKFSDTGSLMQLINDESTRRLKNNWIEGIKNFPLNHLILELIEIESFKLWMEYNKFLQIERLEALIATLLASQTSSMNRMVSSIQESMDEAKKSADDASQKIEKDNPNYSNNSNNKEDTMSKMGF